MAVEDLWAKYFQGNTPNELLASSKSLATTEKGYRDYVAAMLQKIGGLDSEAALAGRNAETSMEQAMRNQGLNYERGTQDLNNRFADQGILNSGIALDAQGRLAGDYLNTVNDIRSQFSGSMDQMYQSIANQKAAEAANLAKQDQARAEQQAQWGQYMAQIQAQQQAAQVAQQQYQQQIQQLLSGQGQQTAGVNSGVNNAGSNSSMVTPTTTPRGSGGGSGAFGNGQQVAQPPATGNTQQNIPYGPNNPYRDPVTGVIVNNGYGPFGGAAITPTNVPAGGIPTNIGANAAGQVTNPTAAAGAVGNKTLPGMITTNPMTPQSTNPNAAQTTPSGSMPTNQTAGIQATLGTPTGANAPKPAPTPAPQLPPTGLLGQLGLNAGHVDGFYNGQYQGVPAGLGSSVAPLIATPWSPAQLQAQQAQQAQQQQLLLGPPPSTDWNPNNNPGIIRTY